MIRDYILKEYGAWTILTLSFGAGLLASGSASASSSLVFFCLCLLINSKQAYTLWSRNARKSVSMLIFLCQMLPAAAALTIIFQPMLDQLLPFALVPCLYLALVLFYGEHKTLTELAGFWTLTLAALAACASVGKPDAHIYLGTALFFSAGVFKVKLQLRRTRHEKLKMISYALFCCIAYIFLGLPVAALLPLIENIIFAATLYHAKLRTTGWIEAAKGAFFALIFGLLY